MLQDTLQRIAELQRSYSSENTPAMNERGNLIRHQLGSDLEGHRAQFASVLGVSLNDLLFDASDGIGRKSRSPWFRISSKKLSPTARDGYYLVIHFSLDGKRFYVTLGCSSTVLNKGSLDSIPDELLAKKNQWALDLLVTQEPKVDFPDQIDLGSEGRLTVSFQKATFLAREFDPATAKEAEVIASILKALSLLSIVYGGQAKGSLASSEEQTEESLKRISKPSRTGQGFGLTGPQRKAVELRAMKLAGERLRELGYSITDTSSSKPFDFLAKKPDGTKMKVEVKGTSSPDASSVFMTKNEVELHQREAGATILFVVSGIQISSGTMPAAAGGQLHEWIPWSIGDCHLDPMAYQVTLR